MSYAFEYAMENKIELSKDYPYTGLDGDSCLTSGKGIVQIDNYVDIAENDVDALGEAVN